ncbi:MAG TPA: ABC transporter permease [Devosiaceae bacterium]|jgi:NitT/TauT family transport system permease protein
MTFSQNARRPGGLRWTLWFSPSWIYTIVILAIICIAMENLVGPVLNPLWLPKPTQVAVALFQWVGDGSIWLDIQTTLTEVLYGFAIGVVCALIVVALLSLSRFATDVFMPFIMAAYSLPKVALVPVFILLLGIGIESKVAQVSLNVFFIILLTMLAGIQSINPVLGRSIQIMGASQFEILRMVKLPAALAWLFSGMRLSARYAIGGAVVVEVLSSNRGIGFRAAQATNQLEPAGVFAAAVILVVIGAAMTWILQVIEDKFLAWRL